MPEQALYFSNSEGARLFGVLSSPPDADSSVGVAFCHPCGDEKQKSYRTYVSFARVLHDAGIPSLRFDCYGFGDSEGDIIDATIETQVADTLAAVKFLRERCNLARVVLIGVRLGGSIAALASNALSDVVGLSLIAPIVDGEQYWKSLLQTQQMSFLTRGLKSKSRDVMLAELDSVGHIEIAADVLCKPHVEQLKNMNLLNGTTDFSGSCFVTAVAADDTGSAQARALAEHYQAAGAAVAEWAPENRDFWTSQALYEGYLPTELYTRTTAWLNTLR